MKKFLATLALSFSLLAAIACSGCGSDTIDFDFGEDDGTTSMTVLVYMIGSDLESNGGYATKDLEEMCTASLGDRVNLVVEAGGAKKWQNNVLKGKSTKRFEIKNGGVKVLDDLGKKNMVKSSTLADFLKWGTSTYKTDRYCLVLWDHGGGTQMGFGQDEVSGGESLLSLADIDSALKASKAHFDFIGFDACLMGTIETAATCAPYADYLIASEETEGGDGWYYAEWLNKLGTNPSVDTVTLGSCIVDQYVNGPDTSFFSNADLSLIDLSKVDAAYEELCTYLASCDKVLTKTQSGYQQFANARAATLSFGEDQFDQVDIIDYAQSAGVDCSALVTAIKSTLAYQDSNYSGANGLAVFFPYSWPQYYEQALTSLKSVGLGDSKHQSFFMDFMTLTVVGQKKNGGTDNPFYILTQGTTNYSKTSWYNAKLAKGITEEEVETVEVPKKSEYLELVQKGDEWYLQLSDDEWQNVTQIVTSVFVLDKKGNYLDLGYENAYETDDSGDIHVTYDYTWTAVNDEVVSFYLIDSKDEGSDWYTYGYSPAKLNGADDIDVLLYWDKDHKNGAVIGFRYASEADEHGVFNRGTLDFLDGDKIQFTMDMYDSDGKFKKAANQGSAITYSESAGLTVSRVNISKEYRTEVSLGITDIYGNQFWTENVQI